MDHVSIMKLYKNKDTKRWREERKEWMTGLKNKNGALQRDKLKMGIGKNERMMESQRDRDWWNANNELWEIWRDWDEKDGADIKTNGGEKRGRKCEAAGALLLHCWCSMCLCTPNFSLLLHSSASDSLFFIHSLRSQPDVFSFCYLCFSMVELHKIHNRILYLVNYVIDESMYSTPNCM